MTELLHEIPRRQAQARPEATALVHKGATLSYAALGESMQSWAAALLQMGCSRHDRVAVFLPKQFETVVMMFGTAAAGCVFVPVNPLLKPGQVEHILNDCNVRVLVTSPERLVALEEILGRCPDLRHVVLTGEAAADTARHGALEVLRWSSAMKAGAAARTFRVIDTDMAAILYTSGSTGKPKGVVLSHRNMVTGAHSVAQYLGNQPSDRLLAVLPFSFDYGFSQLSTAFHTGACVVLMDYLFAKDILTLLVKERITGLAGVPPLWSQLTELSWPATITEHLRYITNSGGAMPAATLQKLRHALPRTRVFLMYGLTEAFRSTYLPPEEIDKRPGSMGKAIPNAEILVVRPDGTPCAPNEPGELVHRGSLVSLGYWNDAEKTAVRFKPAPGQPPGLRIPEMAVWSGDTVRQDEDGFLYFVGRRDEMIKTSGYRVSPTEIEEVIFASGVVADAAAVGVPHPTLGQAIVIVATAAAGREPDEAAILDACRRELPPFMLPARIEWRDSLPRNPNGKYDRPRLAAELHDLFAGSAA
jgi:acyl-CoA ligase (AMP-forming) (exosortase A-associated)